MAKKRILIVEDEVIVARDIQNVLEKLNYSVSAVCVSGEAAVKEVEKDPPDLVLMDIILRGKMNGIEAAREILSRFDIPVIFVTAYANISYVNRAKATEPYGYIIKPIDEKRLHIPIELALAKHSRYRKQEVEADKTLKETEIRYQQLVENINEGVLMQDKKGKITYANESFLEMIGSSENEVLGHSIEKLLSQGLLHQKDRKREDITNGWVPYEITWKQEDGTQVYALLSPNPIYDHKKRLKGSVAVVTNITERRKMELELQHSHEELRRLSQYIQSVRERESKRIAREIHDELGQKLTALKMDLSWLSQRIVLSDVGQKRYEDKVAIMFDLIDQTIQTVQKICSELRPGLLDDLGLIPAIEWLSQDFEKRTNIKCRIRLECEELEINPEASTAIFRICQEALTNIARHSKAKTASISLRDHEGYLELVVRDNGVGIKRNEIFSPKSLGLMGMRERLWPFGGDFDIKGVSKKGTTLRVRMPMEITR